MLTQKDREELNAGAKRVLELMKSGKWCSREEICLAAGINGVPASEGLRRARELRDKGYTLDKLRISDTRTWIYRLKK